jgi:hypothetical protein
MNTITNNRYAQDFLNKGNRLRFQKYVRSLNWVAGTTKHLQTYHSFLRAASLRVDPAVATEEVVRQIQAHGGQLLMAEVRRQLGRAYQHVAGGESICSRSPVKRDGSPSGGSKKVTYCPHTLRRVAQKIPVCDIAEFIRSRSPLPPALITSRTFLDALYREGEKIVVFTVFKSQGQMLCEIGKPNAPALPSQGPDGVWFLTNPVDGSDHPNPRQRNKPSRRSEESVTAWRYMVVESDEAPEYDWLCALVRMPLRIVAIYSSGGKSVHALVRLDAETKLDWDAKKDAIKSALVTLGADPGALTAVRLSRLPCCWRGDRRQELLYLNPVAYGTPIEELPVRPQMSEIAAASNPSGIKGGHYHV